MFRTSCKTATVTSPSASVALGLGRKVEIGPSGLPLPDARGPAGLGEAVDTRQVDHDACHCSQKANGRRRAADQCLDGPIEDEAPLLRLVADEAVSDGSAAVMAHLLDHDQVEDALRLDAAQADALAALQRQSSGHAPAVAVEQRRRPEIGGALRHAPIEETAER